MTAEDIAAAWRRAEAVLQRRPESGLHDDSVATARWDGGLRMAASHANGARMLTDMPTELGGGGEQVTPGWLLRAGLASCTATCIAMQAALQQVELLALEVSASSRSDLRGLLGMSDEEGVEVDAGPREVAMCVRIAARDVSRERLRMLVEQSCLHSPMARALANAVPVAVRVEIEGG